MRIRTILTVGVAMGLAMSLVMAATFTIQGGYRGEYQLLRAEANEVAASITIATEGDFAQKPAEAVRIGELTNGVGSGPLQIMFLAGDAANDTFSWRIWLWSRTNGPAECAAYGTGIFGEQQVVRYPDTGLAATTKFWADTISITAQYWPAEIEVFDEGNNRICKLLIDPLEYEWIYVEITDADGTTGIEALDVAVYYRIMSAASKFNSNKTGRGATLVVSAADSRLKGQRQADYRCTGTADEVKIQAALDALPDDGGKVLCLEGNYVFTSSLLIPDDDIELEFAYGSTVKIIATGHNLDTMTLTDPCYSDTVTYLIGAVGRDNIKIKGVRMDWEHTTGSGKFTEADEYAGIIFDTCTNLTVDDCKVEYVVQLAAGNSNRQFGILAVDCNDFLITRSEGNYCGYEGIGMRGANNNGIVSFCRGKGNTTHAIQAAYWAPNRGGACTGFTNITFFGNNCGPSVSDDIIAHGLSGEGAARVAFIGNNVNRIKVFGEIDGVTVSGNTLYGLSTANIMVNNLPAASDDAIMQNVMITGNVLDFADSSVQATTGGIQLSSQTNNSAAGKIRNVTISNNNLRNRYIELRANNACNTDIENTLITGNTISIFNGTIIGIKLELRTSGSGGIKRTNIIGNNIYVKNGASANGSGIELETDSTTTGAIDETFISGNHIDSDDKGVYLEKLGGNITDVVMQGNIIDAVNVIETDEYNDSIYFKENTVLTCTSLLEVQTGADVVLFIAENNNIKAMTNWYNGDAPTSMVTRGNLKADVQVNEKGGAAATIADGGTIAHGMGVTPTYAIVVGSVTGDIVSVTTLDGTNITVAIKDEGGGAGTTQTIYWRAYYDVIP